MKHRFSLARASTRRYARRLFLSFIIILLLALSSSLLIYNHAADAIKSENQTTNHYMLTELARVIDARMASAQSLLLAMDSDTEMRQAILRERYRGSLSLVESYDFYKRVKSMYQLQYFDVFVYLRASGRVVSGRFANTYADLYFSTNYDGTRMDGATLNDMIAQGCAKYPFTCGKDVLAVAQALPLTNEQLRAASAIAVVVLDKAFVASFKEYGEATGRALCVTAQDGTTLISAFPGEEAGNSRIKNGITRANGKTYIAQTWLSADSGLSYTLYTDEQVLYESVRSLKNTSFLIFAAFLAGGLIAAFLIMRSNYRPIGRLVSEVIDKRPAAGEMLTLGEIPCIRHVLLSALDERERHAGILRAGFIGRVLQGLADPREDIIAKFKEYGISLVSDRFILYALRVERAFNDSSRTDLEKALDDAFTQALGALKTPHTGLLVSHHSGLFSYLLNLSDGETGAERAARAFQEIFARETGCGCTVAAGRELCGWDGLTQSYLDSLQMMDARVLRGPGSYIPYSAADGRALSYNPPRPEEAEKALISCVKRRETSPEAFVAWYAREAAGGEMTLPTQFRLFAHDLCELTASVKDHLEISEEELKTLSVPDNLPEFERALCDLLSALASRWQNRQRETNDQMEDELCERVLAYIQSNLASPSLCPESIGEAFSIGGAYLSKRYKARAGQTLSAAIANARVERVRELLVQTDQGLDAIALTVGLIDASALIRVFKKAEGVTPGEYRKLYKNGR